jgi:pantoate--beta-alanine ligase
MESITIPQQMRERSRAARRAGLTVGLVPTMGYLHEGHMSLVRRAKKECGLAVASIFVNPTQFAPGEDFERYPRDLERDRALLEREGTDVLFHPSADQIYRARADGSPRPRTWVTVEGLSETLEGAPAQRGPEHFRGVATVVAKLINIVEPDAAYFGQKDAQQAILIRAMARDLDMGARIEVCPTVREPNGLAMSSRNQYLSPVEREAAAVIYRALSAAAEATRGEKRSPRALLDRARIVLAGEPMFRVEYLELVSSADLQPIETASSLEDHLSGRADGDAMIAVAGRMGRTRLIDNIVLAVKA